MLLLLERENSWLTVSLRFSSSVSISFFTLSYKSLRAWSHRVSICSIKIPRLKHSSVRCRWWIEWCKWTVKKVSRCRLWSRISTPRGLGTTAGWLGTWDNFHCRLIRRLEFSRIVHQVHSILQFQYFRCELVNSSPTFSQFLPGEPLVNSSTSWMLLRWFYRNTLSRCADSSWSLACSLRDVSYPRLTWSASIRREWISLWNSRIEQSRNSALQSCFSSSDLCLFVSFSDSESLDWASFPLWLARCAKGIESLSEWDPWLDFLLRENTAAGLPALARTRDELVTEFSL